MAKISTMGNNDRTLYLALDNPNASEDILFARDVASKMQINPSQRVLLIGLGGCGIRVVNRVKEIIQAKFQDHDGKIAFLAIDTDSSDLRKQTSLDQRTEAYQIPRCDAQKYIDPKKRTPFTNSWIHPKFSLDFNRFPEGAGQNRQAMRCMLYDDTDQLNHVDKQVVQRIKEALQKLRNGFNTQAVPGIPAMRLEVMVVLGVAGGTGSGGLIDIAQFVRAAVGNDFGSSYGVSGFFFTKDVVEYTTLGGPQDVSKAQNCYAALKELDYYMSVSQREQFRPDILQFSPNGEPPVITDRTNPLYTSAYIVNGSGGAEAFNQAIGAVSEGIVNLIADAQSENAAAVWANVNATAQQQADTQLVTSFRSNQFTARNMVFTNGLYNALGNENNGAFAEDIFDYNAIGVGTASVPEQLFKTYAINIMAQTVAGTGVPGFAPAAAIQGWPDTPLTQVQGEAKITDLLQLTPENLAAEILAKVKQAINWPANHVHLSADEIRGGNTQRAAVALGCTFNGANQTKTANQDVVVEWIENYVREKYNAFLTAARSFLLEFGPRAFVNLYYGIAPQDNRYVGIAARLNTWSGLDAAAFGGIRTDQARAKLNAAQRRVDAVLLGRAAVNVTTYNNAFLEYKRMETACKVRDHLIQGLYRTEYLDKIRKFAEDCSEFAFVLEQLLNTYSGYSDQISTFNGYRAKADEDAINVNILGQQADYDWAIQQTKDFVQQIRFDQVREDLIQSFLDNPLAWTDTEGGESPRRLFDKIMAKHLNAQVGAGLQRLDNMLSITSYLQMKQGALGAAGLQTDVNQLIANLVLKASVRYNKSPQFNAGGGNEKKCLMVPKGLMAAGNANGANLLTAIQNAAAAQQLDIFPSTVGDKLVCFRVETALPIYAMRDLQAWASVYDSASANETMHSNMSAQDLYGKPSIYDPETGLAWRDYPELTKPVNGRDPRQPDAIGRVSPEGIFMRDVLDPLFEKALQHHIIEREKTAQGYQYWYYDLTIPSWNYAVDLRFCPKDADGYYSKGAALFNQIAQDNKGTLQDMKHEVMINNPGFNDATTDADRALDRAKRALRKNVPMFIAVKRSVLKAEELFREIDTANEQLRQQRIQDYVPQYIALGLLEHDTLKQWSVSVRYPGEARGRKIATLLPALLENRNNPLFTEGMVYYVLVSKFIEAMRNDPQVITVCDTEWGNLQNNAIMALDVRELQKALARLEEMKPEADAIIAKYEGATNILNANDLRTRLGIDAERFQFIMNCYKSYLSTYDSLIQTIESIQAAAAGK